MDQVLVDLWADIGAETYWKDLLDRTLGVFVPFRERWPQPGFVGSRYFDSSLRVVVMGQNPRASNTPRASDGDKELFRLIKQHTESRTIKSLNTLFTMMQKFMLGIEYKPAWKPITAVRNHLYLRLDDIAYLNLIPLATYDDRIVPAFKEAFDLATKKQLKLLDPVRIVVYGKGAYENFIGVGGDEWDVRYIEQRNYQDAPDVRTWLGL